MIGEAPVTYRPLQRLRALLVGRYCSYLLLKQAGGTPQILVDKTSPMTGRLRV